MRRPTIIILTCISFIVGIGLAYFFIFELSYWWLGFVVVAIMATLLVSKSLRIIPIAALALVCGIGTLTLHQQITNQNSLAQFQYQKVEVHGQLKGDPYWDQDHNYVFVLTNPVINGKLRNGELRIKTFSGIAKEGNELVVTGKVFPTLTKPGYQISYANVTVVSKSQPFLVQVKQLFYKGLETSLPEPSAAFTKGILLGARSALPQDVQDTMNTIGLSHVVAVSGYNLTILVVLLQRVLKRRWRWGSLVLCIGLIVTFTVISGASASIVRAAIMAIVFLVASYYGRNLSVLVCLAITAALTLLVNPTSAMDDLGWQLSFLSLTGVVVLTPILLKVLPKRTKLVSELLAVTIAAQIATVPFIMYIFGQYSLVAVIANMVVMPVIPILMMAGFVAGILGIILPYSAYILTTPLNFGLQKLLELFRYFESFRGLIVSNKPSLSVLMGWYTILIFMGVIGYHKNFIENPDAFKLPDQMLQ